MFNNMTQPEYDRTKKVACALQEDSDRPGHPLILIRVFVVHFKSCLVFSYKVFKLSV